MALNASTGRAVLRSTRVVTPARVDGADIEIVNGVISAVSPYGTCAGAVDLGDNLIAPGLIDIQLNGGFGFDFSVEPESIWAVGERLPETGVTAFVPTLVTVTEGVTAAALDALRHRPTGFTGAEPLGLHLEGPALSPDRKGAHNPELLRPLPFMEAVADPLTVMVTVAPEIVGPDLIAEIVDADTVVSIGHTDASFEVVEGAIDAGARHVTHLFNAMRPLTHRDPGPIAAALLDERVTVSVIPDGIHVHPGALRLVTATIDPNRLVAITDATAAMGMPPGDYTLGSLQAVSDGSAIRLSDGTLAGSILTVDRAVRYLTDQVDLSISSAIAAASTNPARVVSAGLRGSVEVGAQADLCVLDPSLFVKATMVEGNVVFGSLS